MKGKMAVLLLVLCMLISGCSAESECWELYYDEDGVKNWRYYEDIGYVGGIVFDDESYAEHI